MFVITSADYSMKTFKDLVKRANGHFTLRKSSLKNLIQALGDGYNDSKGDDRRTLERPALIQVQECIWPVGEGTSNTPWGAKKRKYKEALGYLAETLFGLGKEDALLVASYKTGWGTYLLTTDMKFVSKSGATTDELNKSLALSGHYASEVCIPAGGLIGDWDHHKLVFGGLMKTEKDGSLKSAGAVKNQGFGPNTYCFARMAGTEYYCQFDLRNVNLEKFSSEIAFPGDVALDCIKPYPQGKPARALWSTPGWDKVK
jgi:hypothetical protein